MLSNICIARITNFFVFSSHLSSGKFLFLSVQYPDQNVQHHEADTAAAGTKRQKRSPTRARDVPVRRLISFVNFSSFFVVWLFASLSVGLHSGSITESRFFSREILA